MKERLMKESPTDGEKGSVRKTTELRREGPAASREKLVIGRYGFQLKAGAVHVEWLSKKSPVRYFYQCFLCMSAQE